jgi:serine/threonine-protein kinase RsbT
MGFGIIDQARIATVISELARNVVLYAGSGQIILIRVDSRGRVGLEIVCEDQGPGIEDLDLVMNSEHPAEQGEGMGLSGTRRLMDEFEIQTEIGAGTKVIVRKWLP